MKISALKLLRVSVTKSNAVLPCLDQYWPVTTPKPPSRPQCYRWGWKLSALHQLWVDVGHKMTSFPTFLTFRMTAPDTFVMFVPLCRYCRVHFDA